MIHAKPAVKEKKSMNSNTILLLLTIGLFVVMYAAGCIAYADKGFTKLQTFLDILKNNAGLICVTCGMTAVMITGGIDISVGALIAIGAARIMYTRGMLGGAPADGKEGR